MDRKGEIAGDLISHSTSLKLCNNYKQICMMNKMTVGECRGWNDFLRLKMMNKMAGFPHMSGYLTVRRFFPNLQGPNFRGDNDIY